MNTSHGASLGGFDVQKAIAAVGYLVERTGASMYPVMKMMYLADKAHLGRYGRFISGDSYAAMKQGPVPSNTYNMIKAVRGDPDLPAVLTQAKDFLAYHDDYSISLKRAPNLGELSDSDVECLEETAQIYSKMGMWAVRDLAHDKPWKKTWAARWFAHSRPMDIKTIAGDLDNSEALLDHLRDPSPGEAVLLGDAPRSPHL